MSLTAKNIVKNKFWIVEQDGQQVATIQSTPDGVSYVQNDKREKFLDLSSLKNQYSIVISKEKPKKRASTAFEVSGYPCDHKPYNALFNLSKKLPVYTKSASSKSFYCAGHYLIKFNTDYVQSFCPKLITLNRYEFLGPFVTKQEMNEVSKSLKGADDVA